MSHMVTTCSNCRQNLAVTAADLRVGQGYVRCGRCDKVFNALLTLAEDVPAPTEPQSVARGTMSVPALSEDDVLPVPDREVIIPFGSQDDEVEVIHTHLTGEFRSIMVEGSDARSIDILLSDADAGPASEPPGIVVRQAEDFDADAAVGNRPRAGTLWYVAAPLLALGLAGQYLHHNRHELVTVPALETSIQWLYGLFGRTVDPPWDLGRYEVPVLGEPELTGDGRTLVLRAAVAVHKDAPWGQPPPLIRAVLSDQWGNVVATNTLAPQDWLLGEAPARIAPGQRLDARLAMPAPARVTGFMLFPCLPDAGGGVRCTDGTLR
ncbi:MAG TPA: DUF3426 domain-containing protein [Steroidobacteraceae bacterium]|nr:DUF3426 domain-containing protein [Steroidobacteraceae bacterium]